MTITPRQDLTKVKQAKPNIQQYLENVEGNSDAVEISRSNSDPNLTEKSMVLADTPTKTNTHYEDLDKTINSMMETLGHGKYACRVCVKIEPSKKSHMIYHIEAKHIEGVSHPCSHCGKSFRSRNSLTNHISVYHRTT